MMKILVIDTVDMNYNGITDCIYQYLHAMDHTDLHADVLAGTEANDEMVNKFRLIGSEVYHIGNRKKDPLGYAWRLGKLVKQNGYDIVHVHGNSATMTFDLLGAKIGGCRSRIAHVHSTSCEHMKEDKILRPLFYYLATERFACSQEAGEWLFGKKEYRIIPNGRDLRRFSYNEAARKEYRRKLNLKDDLVIGHIGGFNQAKNQRFALEMFAEVLKLRENSWIVFAGDGELLESMREFAKELKIENRVFFLGAISDIEELLSAIDIMVLPSLYEGMPLVALEAQAEGVPCIVSDTITRKCSVSSLVKFLSILDSKENWAKEVVQTVFIDRNESGKEGKKALKEAGYDIVENAKSLKILYQSMVGK